MVTDMSQLVVKSGTMAKGTLVHLVGVWGVHLVHLLLVVLRDLVGVKARSVVKLKLRMVVHVSLQMKICSIYDYTSRKSNIQSLRNHTQELKIVQCTYMYVRKKT